MATARTKKMDTIFLIVSCVMICFCMIWIYFFFGWHEVTERSGTEEYHETVDLKPHLAKSAVLSNVEIFWPEQRPIPPTAQNMPFRPLYSILEEWNPDQPDPPKTFHETLQHFNYGNLEEREMARQYREMEIPFKLYNVSEFHEVSNKWTEDYLAKNIKKHSFRAHVERSISNHFMFWTMKGSRRSMKGFVPPTELLADFDFPRWLKLAKEADEKKISNSSTHYYFMFGADKNENGKTFVSRDLTLFSTKENNFFITSVKSNKGIQCRFGMRGVIAEAHYDSGKNMVAMLRGNKRYILTPPWTCPALGIISDKKHPSFRHSVIDWSDLKQAKSRNFDKLNAIDTIVRTGEVLYIPSFWFHYIVSLEYSIQCNSRSGFPKLRQGQDEIQRCLKM